MNFRRALEYIILDKIAKPLPAEASQASVPIPIIASQQTGY